MPKLISLRDQLAEVAVRRVNEPWLKAVSVSRAYEALAAMAFIENWSRDSFDARVVLAFAKIYLANGEVSSAVPGIEA